MDVIDNFSGIPLPTAARSELLGKSFPEIPWLQQGEPFSVVGEKFIELKGPPPGRVEVKSIPPGAAILVDGLQFMLAETNDTLWLSPGPHVIQVRLGAETRDFQIEVVSGETYTIEADFTQ